MFVKVCGITTKKDLDSALELGFTAIGIVMYPKSKRFIGIKESIILSEHAKGFIKRVAVGIRYEDVKEVEKYFDYIQISEPVTNKNLILSVEEKPTIENDLYIFDKSKGKGLLVEFPDWINEYRDKIILAGGLNPENIYEISVKYKTFGVDVSSGVESTPGIKDYHLMKRFITEYKRSLI
ncbi:MAG: phosphoribosylanthranilate isomerase [Calditerrivibrio sp.]|nr:phosphoribosylanthranilate isomerase [Calditerrivibrio sp.]